MPRQALYGVQEMGEWDMKSTPRPPRVPQRTCQGIRSIILPCLVGVAHVYSGISPFGESRSLSLAGW